jgi:hypothetical protein
MWDLSGSGQQVATWHPAGGSISMAAGMSAVGSSGCVSCAAAESISYCKRLSSPCSETTPAGDPISRSLGAPPGAQTAVPP